MRKILITGGAGFIGNFVVDYLFALKNFEIIVFDCFSKQIHGENYQESFLYKRVKDKATIIQGDVRNRDQFHQALKGVEYIIHLAAETGTGQSMYELSRYTDVNILGTSNMFEIIMKEKIPVKKIILASSRSVYGEGMFNCSVHGVVFPSSRKKQNLQVRNFENYCPICKKIVELISTNETCKVSPASFYAYTKYSQEKMIETMCPVLGIDYTIFRYQNVYGSGQTLNNPYTGILSIFSKLLLSDQSVNIFEDGLESRDFVNVKDVAKVTCLALENEASNSEIINVGTGENISVIRVANILKQVYSSKSHIQITGDFRIGDIRHNKADIRKMIEIFNYIPEISFEIGIIEFSKWVLNEVKSKEKTIELVDYAKSLDELMNAGFLMKASSEN